MSSSLASEDVRGPAVTYREPNEPFGTDYWTGKRLYLLSQVGWWGGGVVRIRSCSKK
jgi:hypothetical protein